jgi:hypothetical protein
VDELLHRRLGRVRFKAGPLAYPVGAFARDRSLRQLITKLDLELGSINPAFPACLWNEKLTPFLAKTVRHFHWHEGWVGKDKLEALHLRQFSPERLKGIDRKARCRDFEAGAAPQCSLQVIAKKLRGIVYYLHDLGFPDVALMAECLRQQEISQIC